MAIATNTFTTYEAVGNREDLTDIIENISPVDTFFTSATGNGTAKARYHEWQTDALAAAAANAQIEGDDSPAAVAVSPTTRAGNYTQILRKVYQITDTQELVDKAGRKSEISYQTQLKLKEIARDIEYALVINSASASGASGTARQLLGVNGWISTNVTSSSASAAEVMTETKLNDNLALIWAQGGQPSTVLCGGFQKRKIDAFTTNTREIDADSGKLAMAVDIYKSSFGTVKVMLHHQINTTIPGTILVLGDMKLWNKAWLRKTKKEELARTGDSRKFMIVGELTLESRQEKGSGAIRNLTTS